MTVICIWDDWKLQNNAEPTAQYPIKGQSYEVISEQHRTGGILYYSLAEMPCWWEASCFRKATIKDININQIQHEPERQFVQT